MDLKGVLNEKDEEQTSEKSTAVRVHKKPIQLRDIENRSSSNRKAVDSHETDEKIKKLLNKEKKNYFVHLFKDDACCMQIFFSIASL